MDTNRNESAANLPRYTVANVLDWHPCWIKKFGLGEARRRINALWGDREALDMTEMVDLPIKPEEVLWLVCRQGVLPDRTLRRIAARFARSTPLADGRTTWDLLTDERSRTAIETAERHARGEATDDELAAAGDAAWAAAGAAAGDAAWAAAGAAAWAAAGDAAWAAAWAAAGAAARAAQLQMLRQILAEDFGPKSTHMSDNQD
jgi:hypothetical protein